MSRILSFSGAGGGGKSSSSDITQTPDNLRSEDTVEAILAIAEGPIGGPVNGHKSFFIGDTQLQNDSGEYNYKLFEAIFYPGDPEGVAKEVKPRLGGSGISTTVSVTLYSGTSVTRTGTMMLDPDTGLVPVDYLDVRLLVQRLLKSNQKGTFDNSVQIQIEYKPESSSTWTPFYPAPVTITGKTTSSYVKEYRKEVPRIAENYQIRVTKKTAENDTENFADVVWESFQEVDGKAKAYPNTAMYQLVGVATDQFSSIPQFSVIAKGKLVRVPSNYDPVAATYSGMWDGTFKIAYSDNPVWVLYDLVMNDQYGMNAYYPVTLDKYDCYEAARWCDQRVADGSRRYTFNSYLTEPRSGTELIRYVAGSFNATFFDDRQGNAYLRVDKDDPAVVLFTPENVVDGNFDYSYSDVTTRYNDLTVTFKNKDIGYVEDRRRVFKQEAIDRNGRIPLDFIAVGCNNAPEAIRRAWYKLLTSQTETESVSFRTNRMGRYLKPFDVILVADKMMGYAVTGRIRAQVSPTAVLLRDALYLEAGVTYEAVFQTPAGPLTRSITAGQAGSVTSLTFTQSLPANLPAFATFALQQQGAGYGLPKPYRIMRIEETDGSPDQYSINAIEINRNKFTDSDNLTDSGEIDYSFVNPDGLTPPEGLTITETVVPYADRPRVNLTIGWKKATNGLVRRYRVEMRKTAQETFRLIGDGPDTEVTISDVTEGTYDFRVTAVSINDVYSRPSAASYAVKYQFYDASLPRVTGLALDGAGNSGVFNGRDARFVWRVNNPTASFELGQEPQGAGTEYHDPMFKEFTVTIWDVLKNEIVYVDSTTQQSYTFTYEKNAAAFGTAHRKFRIEVNYRNTLNRISPPAKLEVSNPAPPLPANLQITAGVGFAMVSFDPPADNDIAGTIIWHDFDSNVELIPTNRFYQGNGNNIVINLDPELSYWFRVAHYDAFGLDELNVTDALFVEAAFKVDTTPPDRPNRPVLSTEVTTDGRIRLTASWDESTAVDFSRFEVAIKRSEEDETQWQFSTPTETSYSWIVDPGVSYDVKVRAIDSSDNRSAYSEVAIIVAARDSTPPGPITDLTADSSFRAVWLSWTNPADADFSHTEIWEASSSDSSTAILIGTQPGAAGVQSSMTRSGLQPGDTRWYWARPVDTSENPGEYSSSVKVTTASLSLPDFPADFGPIPLVQSFPEEGPQTGVQYVFHVGQQKLFKWDADISTWKPAFSFDEIEGQIQSTQIEDGSIQTPHLAANSITADQIAANAITAGKIAAGAVTADTLAAGKIITNRAQIGDAVIDSAHINEIDASKIKAGTILSGSVVVDGKAIRDIVTDADPAARINTGTTKIDPGKIVISGGRTLADWRAGPNQTEINGGAIATNTITANKLFIGARGVSAQGFSFRTTESRSSTVRWDGGAIHWTNDDGNYTRTEVSSGATTDYYIYWKKGEGSLRTTNDPQVATAGDCLHMATNHHNGILVVNYGGTVIDGSQIVTGSILANQIAAGQIKAEHIEAQSITGNLIKAGQINANHLVANQAMIKRAHIEDLAVDTLKLAGRSVTTTYSTENMWWSVQAGDGNWVNCGVNMTVPATVVERDDVVLVNLTHNADNGARGSAEYALFKQVQGGGLEQVFTAQGQAGHLRSWSKRSTVPAGRSVDYGVAVRYIGGEGVVRVSQISMTVLGTMR